MLGPLEVWRGGLRVAVGGPQQRELLALLLLDANRVVSVDRLIGQLWGERPPATARSLLHGCVTDLRRALRTGDDGETGQPLLTRPPGYLIRVRPGELDRDRVDELEAAAAGAAAAGTRAELQRSAALLTEALSLWRGPVLAGLTAPACVTEAARLEELALTLLERRVDVDLRLSRFADLAGELPARVRAQPLREPLWARLIIALYGAGRQADALAAYREVRRTLVDELGIEPNAGLQQLEQAVLTRADPAELVRREAGEPAIAGAATAHDRPPDRPAQLPAAVAGFAGRDGALAELDTLAVAAGSAAGGPATVVISAMSGTAGRRQDRARRALGAPGRRPVPRRPALRQPARLRPRRAGDWARPRRSAASSTRSACRPSGSRPAWTRRPRSTAACWPAGGCWSCWTTPATPSRSARCCPARPAAWSWSPAATGSPAWSPPTAPTRSPSTCCQPPRRASCWPAGSAPHGSPPSPPRSTTIIDRVRPAAARAGDRGRPGRHPPRPHRWPRWPPSCAAADDRLDALDAGDAGAPTCGRCSPGPTPR